MSVSCWFALAEDKDLFLQSPTIMTVLCII